MAQYRHHINNHRQSKRATRLKRTFVIVGTTIILGGIVVGVDWLVTNIRSTKTVAGRDSNATVQSARINIFSSPYFKFQADSSWREVTDELNFRNDASELKQYLYRSFNKNFIEHEILIQVNLPSNYTPDRHYVPTRVLPVQIESDGTLSILGEVSEPCVTVLPKENPNLDIHVVKQNEINYLCNPNQVNDYVVTVGVPGQDDRLVMPHGGQEGKTTSSIHIIYRNVTATPSPSVFERIVRDFKSL